MKAQQMFFALAVLVGVALFANDYMKVRTQAAGLEVAIEEAVTAIAPTLAPAPVEAELQVMPLPEDGGMLYTTLFVPANWQSSTLSRHVKAWMEADPKLAAFRAQTHWSVIAANDPLFAAHQRTVTTLPCLSIQKANGDVILKLSGASLQTTPKALYAAIRSKFVKATQARQDRYCIRGRGVCPLVPQPAPQPAPAPYVAPEPEPFPDTPVFPDTPFVDESPVEEERGLPLWLTLLLLGGGAAGGVVPDITKKYKAIG